MSETNTHNVFATLGATNHSSSDRVENDFYTTDPIAITALNFPFHKEIWEPACGLGHLSEALKSQGYTVLSTDLVDRGYGRCGYDFLNQDNNGTTEMDIITNPPYSLATEFCEKAIQYVAPGYYVAMFLRLSFLEGKKRRELFDRYPPKYVYVASGRISCYRNGDDSKEGKKNVGAMAYAWFIWQKGWAGETKLGWFN